jgi:hypothetical protein
MKISLGQLSNLERIDRVAIQSIDPCIYRITVMVDGIEKLLTDGAGKTLTSPNIQHLKDLLSSLEIDEFVLEHQSTYDEMIGHPPSAGNKLITRLGRDQI